MLDNNKITTLSKILEELYEITDLSHEVLKLQKKRKLRNKESQSYLKKWYAFNLGKHLKKIIWILKKSKHFEPLKIQFKNLELSFLEITEQIIDETQLLIIERISIDKIKEYLVKLTIYIPVLADFEI